MAPIGDEENLADEHLRYSGFRFDLTRPTMSGERGRAREKREGSFNSSRSNFWRGRDSGARGSVATSRKYIVQRGLGARLEGETSVSETVVVRSETNIFRNTLVDPYSLCHGNR